MASLSQVPWSTLPAGSEVLISPGTFSGVTTITSVGTSAAPIVVTASDPTNPPVLADSVDIQSSAYVQISHVTVQSPSFAGFIIRFASSHIAVTDSVINGAPVGISVQEAAGTGHQILRNTINDAATQGINLEVNSDPSARTLVQYNTISRSGQHGIEVRASHYQVEHNTVTASGQASGGTSGIHVYSASASEDSGDDNLVRYNTSYANIDPVAADGNGIEIDHWCDGNTVEFNQVWGNDGAGIILYDGSSNLVQNNTAWDDGRNSGGTHVSLGEIIVSGTAAATAHGNQVWNNLMFSTRRAVPAMYVDTQAVAGGNTIGPNLFYNAAGGSLLRWSDSGATTSSAAQVDSLTGVSGNSAAAPIFADASDPLHAGLRLASLPALHGLMPAAGLLDLAGAAPAAGDAFFGSYYTLP